MSELIPAAQASGGNYGVGCHTTTRVLAGEAEGVRRRLTYALEALGYTVTSESPLQARRRRLKDIVRADFTEHARKVSVSLRQGSDTATVATFDFEVAHGGCMTRGDSKTLERETEAIIALAASPPASSLCRACGTESAGDAHFRRLCRARRRPRSRPRPSRKGRRNCSARGATRARKFLCRASAATRARLTEGRRLQG